MPRRAQYWLMKSEPDVFSIRDLARSPRRTTSWEGVRNYQARNFMRAMQKGDGVLFYHSNADPPAIVGVARVARTAYPDPSAFEKRSLYYDPRSTPSSPRWDMVDIQLVREFRKPLSLDVLRREPALATMEVLRKGSRLSVQPVGPEEWKRVLELAGR